jgi:hypothetical protein
MTSAIRNNTCNIVIPIVRYIKNILFLPTLSGTVGVSFLFLFLEVKPSDASYLVAVGSVSLLFGRSAGPYLSKEGSGGPSRLARPRTSTSTTKGGGMSAPARRACRCCSSCNCSRLAQCGARPEKLRLRHRAARANLRSGPSALPGVLERSKVAFGSRHLGNLGLSDRDGGSDPYTSVARWPNTGACKYRPVRANGRVTFAAARG